MDNTEELLPDFDEMEEFARQAAAVSAAIIIVKHELSMYEASVIRAALTNKSYWVGPKQPSMSYCEKVVAKLGNTDGDREMLMEMRTRLAGLTEQSELLQHTIWISKDKMELYRTISANERKTFL